MKNKSPLILGGAFLFLLVIFFVTTLHPKEKTRGAEPLFKGEKPIIDKIEVMKTGKVRRSKIYYLRGLSGKAARIDETEKGVEAAAPAAAPARAAAQ